ncbi:MAG TPA: 30S ribosomal protein S7 [Candidatus Nanoarchaeia archaeon]|nr:30S ribosomal protein S7 [Candidatus Nanoarchaeia archaeon]
MVSKRNLLKKAKEIETSKIVSEGEEVKIDFSDIKLFNKWDTNGITVSDPGLKSYINLKPIIVPKTFGRNQNTRFWKSKQHIVERLMNHIPVSGHKGKKHYWTSCNQTGQGHTVMNIMIKTLMEVEKKAKVNPVLAVVKAIEHASPREEVVTIQYGGIRHPKAVDCAPQRRVDLVLRWMAQGAFQSSNKKKTKIWKTLADEIVAAYNGDKKSVAISKKFEVERQAASSR